RAPRGDPALAPGGRARSNDGAPAGFVGRGHPRRRRGGVDTRAANGASERRDQVMTTMETIEKAQLTERPRMKAGDTVRVHVRVKEGDKERIQVFEGVIIGLRRGGIRSTFTVRKVSFSQGVERIFPMHSPTIQKVEVVRSAKVRRAKLYFLRDLKGKAARMKEVKKTTGA